MYAVEWKMQGLVDDTDGIKMAFLFRLYTLLVNFRKIDIWQLSDILSPMLV